MARVTAKDMDRILKPFTITCANCGSKDAIAFPAPIPGVVYCPCKSPEWLKSFALFATNKTREESGFNTISLDDVLGQGQLSKHIDCKQ